jgi:colanic acid/amylovoran biosynthesis glycosyltransferase
VAPVTPPPRPVVHSVSCWLPATETWLYNEVRHLPSWVESHVACATTSNLGAFGLPRVRAAGEGRLGRALRRAARRVRPGPLGPVRRLVRESGARVVHSHFGHVGWFDHRATQRLGVRHVVSFYGLDVGRLPSEDAGWRRRYRDLFDEAAAVLCEGPHMAADIAALGCPPERLRVHRLGVDLSRLPPFRPRGWTGDRPLRVLLAGSFREKKGLPDAMDALGLLLAGGLDVEATVIGDAGPGDGGEKRRILAAIDRNGLAERVRLLGFRPHAALLAEAEAHDVFLSPSVTAADGDREGGAPVTIIEMAALGMPVLSTTHGDIPWVLGEPNRALLVPERDPRALATACLRLLDSDWAAIARANRDLVERELDCVLQGERLAEVYFPGAREQARAGAQLA